MAKKQKQRKLLERKGKGKLRQQAEEEQQRKLETELNKTVDGPMTEETAKLVEEVKKEKDLQKPDSLTTSTPADTPSSTSTVSKVSPFRPNPESPGQQIPPELLKQPKQAEILKFPTVSEGKDKYDKFIENHQITQVEDPQLERLKEFMDTEWGLPGVTVMFRGLFGGGYPPIPVPSQWDIPQQLDIIELVWQQCQTDAFLEENWPSVRMMLGDNVLNTTWAAQVMTVLAFFNIIKILPMIIKGYEEQDGKI